MSPRRRWFAKARRHTPGAKNGHEAAYERDVLIPKQAAGLIREYWFEAITLKLAGDTRYTVDWVAVMADDTLEFIEVKPRTKAGGYYAIDDSKVKIKVAAERFPFRFCVVWPKGKLGSGEWERVDIGPADAEERAA